MRECIYVCVSVCVFMHKIFGSLAIFIEKNIFCKFKSWILQTDFIQIN